MRTADLVRAYVDARRSAGVHLAPKTITAYFDSARFAGEWYPPSPEQVTKALQAFRRMSPHSEQSHLRRLKTLSRYASAAHGMPDPFTGVTARHAPLLPHRVFSGEDYRELRNACRDTTDEALLDLVLGTGMRIGEVPLHTAQVSEVYGQGAEQIAFISVTGKTGPRYVPITPRERELLLRTAADGRLWVSEAWPGRPPRPLGVRGLISRWTRLVKRSGLTGRKLGPHTARHTFSSGWVMGGGSLESLQSVLGHQSIETTEGYVNRLPGWVAAQLLRHDPLSALRRAANTNSGRAEIAAPPSPATQESDSYATGD